MTSDAEKTGLGSRIDKIVDNIISRAPKAAEVELEKPLSFELKLPKGYVPNNKNIIAHIKNDIANNRNFHYLFTGKAGCGKTYLSKIISECVLLNWDIIDARKIYKRYIRSLDNAGELNWIESKARVKNLIFDDVGAEFPNTESAHGFIGDLIEIRYEAFKRGSAKRTIYTTNLGDKELNEVYGSRVVDRLYEMVTIMVFKDISFREKIADKREIIKY